jgi:hypothetical protein
MGMIVKEHSGPVKVGSRIDVNAFDFRAVAEFLPLKGSGVADDSRCRATRATPWGTGYRRLACPWR